MSQATNEVSTAVYDLDARFAHVPGNYRMGARQTRHQSIRHAAVLRMLHGLQGRVLDYGCGYGDQVYAMSQQGYCVCGVDLDPERVAFAQHEYGPLEFKRCTPEDAPYDDASFDIVTSIVVLNFIPDANGHMRSIRRLLRPGGHLLLAWKNTNVVRNVVRCAVGRPSVPSRLWMRSRNEVRQLLKENQFSSIKESYFYDPPMESWKHFSDFLFGTFDQLMRLAHVSATAGYFLALAKRA